MKENYHDNVYIFGIQIDEKFSFNYKIIIINLLFKTFFLKLCLYDEFEFIYIWCSSYIKGQTCLVVGTMPTPPKIS